MSGSCDVDGIDQNLERLVCLKCRWSAPWWEWPVHFSSDDLVKMQKGETARGIRYCLLCGGYARAREGINMDITTLPTTELIGDLIKTKEDIAICQETLKWGVFTYSGGSVRDRLDTNKQIKALIEAELARRRQLSETMETGDEVAA